MKMKNFMAIAIAATMLTLVGCGNKNDSSSVSDVPASSTEVTTEATATTTTTVETTTVETTTEKVETTTAEATELDKSTGDSMAFADMADAIDKAMSAHANDPADTADDMLELCRATIKNLKANGLPLGEYTGDAEADGFDENGEYSGEENIGKISTVSATICKMPASALNVSDIEGITLERVSTNRMIGTDANGSIDGYHVTLRFSSNPKNAIAMGEACENIFTYFIENGYADTGKDNLTRIETARKPGGSGEGCRVQVKNDKFEIMITPHVDRGICDIDFYKM